MDSFRKLLEAKQDPGVYQLPKAVKIDELSQAVKEQGFRFFDIDGQEIFSKETFLKKFAEVMDFPEHFGSNWDAFEDCITDLEGDSANGYVLLYSHVEHFAQRDSQEWKVAFDILNSAAEFWQETDTPMYILLQGSDAAVSELPKLAGG